MIPSTGWMLGAACAREGLRNLPWTAEDTSPADRARMARVCASCPVLAACEISTVLTETTAGFWAGQDRAADVAPVLVDETPATGLPVQGTLDLPGLDLPEQAAA